MNTKAIIVTQTRSMTFEVVEDFNLNLASTDTLRAIMTGIPTREDDRIKVTDTTNKDVAEFSGEI